MCGRVQTSDLRPRERERERQRDRERERERGNKADAWERNDTPTPISIDLASRKRGKDTSTPNRVFDGQPKAKSQKPKDTKNRKGREARDQTRDTYRPQTKQWHCTIRIYFSRASLHYPCYNSILDWTMTGPPREQLDRTCMESIYIHIYMN